MSSPTEIASSFILGAPPGELHDVVNDIQTLTSDTDPGLIAKLRPAFQQYNEEQLATTKLPGSERTVIISAHNRLPDGGYIDTETKTSFTFDQITQKSSSPTPYTPSTVPSNLSDLSTALATHVSEHYPSPSGTWAIYPTAASPSSPSPSPSASNSNSITILIVSNKYSPANFWTGRWRSEFHISIDPDAAGGGSGGGGKGPVTLSGRMRVDVHYYEDGNVRLQTDKSVSVPVTSSGGDIGGAIVRTLAAAEKAYQTELGRAFVALNEDGFKRLRRVLPVSRQKVEWEKVGGYRLGRDLRGE